MTTPAYAWFDSHTGVYGGTYFAPERTCTRAQIVTFLYAAYEVRE